MRNSSTDRKIFFGKKNCQMCGPEPLSDRSSKIWAEVGTGVSRPWEAYDNSNDDGRKSSLFARMPSPENNPDRVDTPKWISPGNKGQNAEPEVNLLRKMSIMDNNKLKNESELFD